MLFDKQKVKKLETAYKKAVKNDQEEFTFEGTILYTPYAKYLLEYLRSLHFQ